MREYFTDGLKQPSLAVGIDVGGTQIRVGVIKGMRVLDGLCRTPTSTFTTATQLFDWLDHSIDQLCNEHGGRSRMAGIGMGLPGKLDESRGSLLRSINVSYLEGVALRAELSQKTKLPVTLMTDADAATWGEICQLSPRPDRLVHLRLGTGVACGCVIEGKVVPLERIGYEHLRLLVVDQTESAIPCACGLRGCLETIASGKALLSMAKAHGLAPSVAAWQEGIVQGDSRLRKIGDEIVSAIVRALFSINRAFQPDVITLGGGVVTHWPMLIDAVRHEAEKTFDEKNLTLPRIMQMPGSEESGVLGAACLIMPN